jgi:hypothetical protein
VTVALAAGAAATSAPAALVPADPPGAAPSAAPSLGRAAGDAPANPPLRGPQLYRLRTAGGDDGAGRDEYAYALVFPLTRVHFGVAAPYDSSSDESTGHYTIAGVPVPDWAQDRLYSRRRGPRRCVVVYIDRDWNSTEDLRRLRRYRVGRRVRVALTPLVNEDETGATYRYRPVLRRGGEARMGERAVQRQLREIGCARRGR